LLRMNEAEFDARRERVARRNLDWAVEKQHPNGLFEHCSFQVGKPPFTHTLAYTARGLLESGLLFGEAGYLDAAERRADAVLRHLQADGFLPGAVGTNDVPAAAYCCLTGNCQFAIVWSRLLHVRAKPSYRSAVVRALDYVMSTQDIATANLDVRGGIK